MKNLEYKGGKSINDSGAFSLTDMQLPTPTGHDVLVVVKAVSVNPVDTKVRDKTPCNQDVVLGWDAAGVVAAIGSEVTMYQPGDRVFYAGDVTRAGCNASHQLVDERIIGRHPQTLDFLNAAAMPLTSITAWEALFDRMKIDPDKDAGKTILIINGAGGVGSIAIQLAKQVAGLNVIATASRDETRDWCLSLGADHVVNHYEDLTACFSKGLAAPDFILCLTDTDPYFETMAELVAPQGMICAVVDTKQAHDLSILKAKSVGFVWEFMFTRAMYGTQDMSRQQDILNQVARLLDTGKLRSTMMQNVGRLSPETISTAHQTIESGRMIGKLVLEGIEP